VNCGIEIDALSEDEQMTHGYREDDAANTSAPRLCGECREQ
jgi:hypothetical protein